MTFRTDARTTTPLRIGVTCDLRPAPQRTDHWDEWDEPETIATIEQALRSLGHTVVRVGSAEEFLRQLPQLRERVELIFNLAEGHGNRTREAQVPTLCEMVGLPYVGSSPQTLMLALDKWITKQLWRAEGLPVPAGVIIQDVRELARAETLRYPLIVKPRYEGSGIGLDAGAIVADVEALRARVAWALATYREPALVEEFIRGGEVTVCLIGDPLEALPPIQRHVDPATTLGCHIAQKTMTRDEHAWMLPLDISSVLEQHCAALAARACQTLGCRDLARVDLRVNEHQELFLLEVNPLPSLDAGSSFALLAETRGWDFSGLLQEILSATFKRVLIPHSPGNNT